MMPSSLIKYLPFAILLVFLAVQLFFISADPDPFISWSTGPFTDEGLNTIQLRNWINHAYISIWECDNLIKTPLFAGILLFPYLIFGSSLETGRIGIILICLGISFLILKQKHLRFLGFSLIPILFCHYYIFHFFHYTMAEILCSFAAFAGIYFYALYHQKFQFKHLLLSATCFSAAYFLKIQYLYLFFLFPALLCLDLFFGKITFKVAFKAFSFLLLMAAVYFLIWLLPNWDVFVFMMKGQSGGLDFSKITFLAIPNNFRDYFMGAKFKSFNLTAYALLFVGMGLLYFSKDKWFRYLFIGSVLWILLESHKLCYTYSPTRYFISSFFSILLMISIVTWKLIMSNKWNNTLKYSGIAIILWLFFINLSNIYDSFNSRSYVIRDKNKSMANEGSAKDTYIGSIAASFNYQSKARAMPIFLGFLNDHEPMEKFDPDYLIIFKEEESMYKESNKSILQEMNKVDSCILARNWEVNFYKRKNSN